jgi:hypothetical protein
MLPARKTPGSSIGAAPADAGISFRCFLATCHDHTLSVSIWRSANFLVQITERPFFVKDKIELRGIKAQRQRGRKKGSDKCSPGMAATIKSVRVTRGGLRQG